MLSLPHRLCTLVSKGGETEDTCGRNHPQLSRYYPSSSGLRNVLVTAWIWSRRTNHFITTLNQLLSKQFTVRQRSVLLFVGTVNCFNVGPTGLDMCQTSKYSGLSGSIYTDWSSFKPLFFTFPTLWAAHLITKVFHLHIFFGCCFFNIHSQSSENVHLSVNFISSQET